MKFIRPKIIISKCLEFEKCRFDGQIINNRYIQKLKNFIDFIPICPEVEIGMGTPRKPIRVVQNKNGNQLIQSDTNIDYSYKINKFSKQFIEEVNRLDGIILKSASPSCGINTAKYYNKSNTMPIGKGSGLFASQLIKKFPNHPKEEEKRLNNPFIREHFYTCIFTLADFSAVKSFDALYKFQAKHKYLFMAYNQKILYIMGNIAANKAKKTIEIILKEYYDYLLLLLSNKPRFPSNINAQMHVMGYFKKLVSANEKKHLLYIVELYRNRKVPISAVNSILSSWIFRFEDEYLMKQSFFNPFPIELIENEKSRFE